MRRHDLALWVALGLAVGICATGYGAFTHARDGMAACGEHYVEMSAYTASNSIPASAMPDCSRWNALLQASALSTYFTGILSVGLGTTLLVSRLSRRAPAAAAP